MSKNRRRREDTVKVRVNEIEKSLLNAKADAAGMTVAELLRDRIFQVAVVNRVDWQRRTYQLAQIGNNLNQITHWVNIHKSEAEAHQVVVALLRLERAIRAEFRLDSAPAKPEEASPS